MAKTTSLGSSQMLCMLKVVSSLFLVTWGVGVSRRERVDRWPSIHGPGRARPPFLWLCLLGNVKRMFSRTEKGRVSA